MKLISLELQGFKSFADRLHLDFHEGVTGIVGPNGSGKSNISDAIRWVLGEQSAKTLRGGKMEDVIFAGTQTRRALSFAEVVLTLDNSDGSLDTPYEMVEVRRRLYRSGESEYALNKKKCRLKDITELFMDSGIGREGYSIVGQGRVDDILSVRSEDRREIFDEAGGITKYRARRTAAQRKLEVVEQNLLRIDDILREVERRRGPLAKQAEAAKQYQTLDDEYQALDMARLTHEVTRLKKEEKKLNEDLKNAQAELLAKTKEREAYVMKNEEANAELRQLREEQSQLEQADRAADHQVQDQKRQLALLEQEHAQAKRYLDEREKRLREEQEDKAHAEEELTSLREDLAQEKDAYAKANAEFSKLRETFEELQRIRQEKQQDLLALERQIEKYRLQSLNYQAQEQKANSSLRLAEDLAKQKEAYLQSAQDEVKRLATSLENQQQSYRQLEAKVTHDKEALEALKAKQIETSELADTAQAELRAVTEAGESLQRKIRNLEHLTAGHEGYQYSVRQLMKDLGDERISSVQQADVLGPLGSLMTVPKDYQVAIDQILGASIQNIVVKDERVASRLIQHLRQHRLGRAVFLPLAQLRPHPVARRDIAALEGQPGFIGLARDLVDFAPQAKVAMDYRLGRTLVAETIDLALALHQRSGRRHAWVTLDGDTIQPGGAMAGGQKQQRSQGLGILERQEELKAAKLEQPKLEAQYQSLAKKAQAVLAQKKQDQLALEEAQIDFSDKSSRLHSLAESNAQIERNLQQAKHDLAERKKALEEAEQSRQEHLDLLQSLSHQDKPDEKALEALEKQRDVKNQEADEHDALLEEKRHAFTEAKANVRGLEESIQAQTSMIKRLEKQMETRLARQDLEKAEAEKDRQTLAEQKEALVEAKQKLESLQATHQAKEEELKRHQLKVQEAEASNETFIKTLSRLGEERELLQREHMRLDHRLERLLSRMDLSLNQLWENYELTFEQSAKLNLVPYEGRKSDERLATLRREMKKLGQVNPQAIEEYAELEERYQFIQAQREDLLRGKSDLDELIEEISEVMREQFAQSFKEIQDNFSQIFRELFGGGEAEIRLSEGEDILEADIDIRVSPPGKRMQNLLLLSGGEKTLAAIALLFAIQRLKPTAFCLLDEVEAALDESNIFRFTEYIRRYSEETQFILVTHRKGTMEICDRLYGVSMQEQGVSTVLSVKLRDIEAD